MDEIPEVEGMRTYFGSGVYHCPYCDGWEFRDQRLVVYGRGKNGAGLALALKTWSRDVTLCTDGPAALNPDERERLVRYAIPVREEEIASLGGTPTQLERIVFRSGADLPCRAVFLSTGQRQRCDLARELGCRFTRKGAVWTGRLEATTIPGLYVAGDASKDVQLAVVAAAEGAKAALAINTSLQEEEHQ